MNVYSIIQTLSTICWASGAVSGQQKSAPRLVLECFVQEAYKVRMALRNL